MSTYLDAIVAAHRDRVRDQQIDLELLESKAAAMPPARDFTAALRDSCSGSALAVIAEIKRRSPSKGDLAPSLDPQLLATTYERAGAACLSVLTDEAHFGGSREDLIAARNVVTLPVLRKDFTVAAADIYEARVMGADAVLLIVAALSEDELRDFHALASALGLAVLVEVHDEMELEHAIGIGATLIGVNQRDLHTFEVDHDRARRVGRLLPKGIVGVAESGIADRATVSSLAEVGYQAILVGEALVTAESPGEALGALRGDGELESAHGR